MADTCSSWSFGGTTSKEISCAWLLTWTCAFEFLLQVELISKTIFGSCRVHHGKEKNLKNKERIGTWKLESVSIWTRWSDLHIINYRLREDCKHIAIGLFVICSLRQLQRSAGGARTDRQRRVRRRGGRRGSRAAWLYTGGVRRRRHIGRGTSGRRVHWATCVQAARCAQQGRKDVQEARGFNTWRQRARRRRVIHVCEGFFDDLCQ